MKKRILFIGPYPPPYAGPEISMKNLLESTLTQRFDVSFLNTNVRKSNEKKGNLDIILLFAFFSFIFRLIWLLSVKRPQLVYSFVTATRQGWLGRDVWCIFLSRIFGAEVVIHMRAGHFSRNYENGGSIIKLIIRNACFKVSRGIVQAESLRDQFKGLIPDDKIISIYNAIDTQKYCNDQNQSHKPEMVLFIGHLAYSKGYCDILKVIPDIADLYPGVQFHFAGTLINKKEKNVTYNHITGSLLTMEKPSECFEKYIRGRYEANYIYHGIADEALKLRLLKECAFFILPSYSEGFSMAVLEALSIGKPVVCTPVGALKEVVKHGVHGLICQPGDKEGLKKNILRLLGDNNLRHQMCIKNAEYVRHNFAIEIIAKQLGDCFDLIINNSLVEKK